MMEEKQLINDLQTAIRDLGHNQLMQAKEIKALIDEVHELKRVVMMEIKPVLNEHSLE